jgi:hypothetical protein
MHTIMYYHTITSGSIATKRPDSYSMVQLDQKGQAATNQRSRSTRT